MAREFKSTYGNSAAAYVSLGRVHRGGVGIYPITPSSPMADLVDQQWSAQGRKNIFGTRVKVWVRCSRKAALSQ